MLSRWRLRSPAPRRGPTIRTRAPIRAPLPRHRTRLPAMALPGPRCLQISPRPRQPPMERHPRRCPTHRSRPLRPTRPPHLSPACGRCFRQRHLRTQGHLRCRSPSSTRPKTTPTAPRASTIRSPRAPIAASTVASTCSVQPLERAPDLPATARHRAAGRASTAAGSVSGWATASAGSGSRWEARSSEMCVSLTPRHRAPSRSKGPGRL